MSARRATIREATLDDYAEIAPLIQRYDLELKPWEEWCQLWEGNPAYRDFGSDWPIGWVVEVDHGRIVGYLGNIPLSYEFEGQTVKAVDPYCWVVDSDYRGYALALLDRFFRQPEPDLFLGTSVSRAAFQAYGVFKTVPVPVGRWDESLMWITQYRGFSQGLLAAKGVPVSKPLSYLLAAGLACRDLPRQLNWEPECEYELEWINDFDDSFDEFWSEFTTKHRGLLLSVRTAELLRWHFRYALQRGRAWIQVARDGEQLVAYATFLRQDNPKFNLKRIRLVDYQALDRTPKLLAPMIARALERCRRSGIHMLEWVGLPHDPTAVSSLRPLRRKLPSWMYFYRANHPDLKKKLANPTAWAPSSFDGDSSL